MSNTNSKWYVRLVRNTITSSAIIGFFVWNAMNGTQMTNNIAVFLSILLFIVGIISLAVVIFIPAEHAKTTKIDIIKYNLWWPTIMLEYIVSLVYAGLAIAAAAYGMFWYAAVATVVALSTFLWVGYMRKVDAESKQYMLDTLAGN